MVFALFASMASFCQGFSMVFGPALDIRFTGVFQQFLLMASFCEGFSMVFGPALDIMSPWLHFTKVFQLFLLHFVSMAPFG